MSIECNADLGHPCDANDGEPCAPCSAYMAESMADALRSYHPHYAKPADYAEQMRDVGRGHLLRDDER
jgi:hypothetical protein